MANSQWIKPKRNLSSSVSEKLRLAKLLELEAGTPGCLEPCALTHSSPFSSVLKSFSNRLPFSCGKMAAIALGWLLYQLINSRKKKKKPSILMIPGKIWGQFSLTKTQSYAPH